MQNQSHKLASFEGLRGIAAFVVVLFHLHLAFYNDSAYAIRHSLAFLPWTPRVALCALIQGSYNGTFAVWIFWIMSAFVLSLQFFLRANEVGNTRAHDYLEDASLRRYPRLFIPVFASILFAYAICRLGFIHNTQLAQLFGEPYRSGWLGNWYNFSPSFIGAVKSAIWGTFFNYDASHSYNNVLWTMEYEFYGSLFLFAFLGLFGHRRSRLFIYVLAALANFKLHLHWLNAFVVGIVLCDLFVNRFNVSALHTLTQAKWVVLLRRSPLIALLSWAAILAGVGYSSQYNAHHECFYLLFATMAVAVTMVSTNSRSLLSAKVPIFLGKISFGLYLIHIPIIFSYSCWAYLQLSKRFNPSASAFLASLTTCIISVALGYLFYLAADRPGLVLSRKFSSFIMSGFKRAV